MGVAESKAAVGDYGEVALPIHRPQSQQRHRGAAKRSPSDENLAHREGSRGFVLKRTGVNNIARNASIESATHLHSCTSNAGKRQEKRRIPASTSMPTFVNAAKRSQSPPRVVKSLGAVPCRISKSL